MQSSTLSRGDPGARSLSGRNSVSVLSIDINSKTSILQSVYKLAPHSDEHELLIVESLPDSRPDWNSIKIINLAIKTPVGNY